VAGPLVPAQMEAGTKGSRPKARFLLVPRAGWLAVRPAVVGGGCGGARRR
jgi:hypothetical protein